MNRFHPSLRIVTLSLSKGRCLLLLSILACLGSRLFAADINVLIPGGSSSEFTTKVYFNYDQLGSGGKKTLHVFPSPCYRFSSPPSVTGDGNVMIISTGTGACGADFNVWLISGKEGWAYVNGAIEPGNYCGCSHSGSGTGTPPTGRGFEIDILNSLAWIYYTNPVNGTNLTACAGCTNDIAVSVVLGNLTSPTSGTVTWTPTPANLGSVTPNSVALSGGNAATKFYAAANGGSGFITANALNLQFAQGNPVTSVSTNLVTYVIKPDLEIDGVASADKKTIGATVVRNYDANNAPRKKIILQVAPINWPGNVILSRNNTKIKIFNAVTGGTEIMFNGTDNKFATTSLPTSLWVEGATASDSMRDVELSLTPENLAACPDKVKFTVLWVTITGKFSTTDNITNGNSAKGNYLEQTVPSRTTLGTGQFWDRMGSGVEFVGTVSPSDFTQSILMERDGEGRGYKGLDGQSSDWTLSPDYPNVPPGSDTSFSNWRDDDPQSGGSGGKIYDSDDPGIFTKYNDVANYIRRSRFNFKAFATFNGTRCASFYNWYCKASYKKVAASATGTATSTSSASLTDTNQSWAIDQWKNGTVSITSGTGAVQFRQITGNTAQTVNVSPDWEPALDNTSVYLINGTNTWTQVNDVSGDNATGSGGPIPLTWNLQ